MVAKPRLATTTDIDMVIDVWAEGLASEPMANWPFELGDVDASRRGLFAALAAAYVAAGAVYVIDSVRAAAAWLSPEGVAQIADVDAASVAAVAVHQPDGGQRAAHFWDWIDHQLPDEPLWFLDVLAVDASVRGSGIGTSLVRAGLAQADTAGQPAFLDTATPANLDYYARFGFEVYRHLWAPDGGPEFWMMRREPQPIALPVE